MIHDPTDDVSLSLRLPPAEVAERIRQASDDDVWRLGQLRPKGNRPFLTSWNGMTFQARKRIDYRNSFQTFFFGSISPAESGTVLNGRFGMDPFVKSFHALCMTGAAGIGVVMLLILASRLMDGKRLLDNGTLLVLPVLFPLMVLGVEAIGRIVASDERSALEQWLRKLFADALVDRGTSAAT